MKLWRRWLLFSNREEAAGCFEAVWAQALLSFGDCDLERSSL
jgi:hypothetical protein